MGAFEVVSSLVALVASLPALLGPDTTGAQALRLDGCLEGESFERVGHRFAYGAGTSGAGLWLGAVPKT